MNRRTFLNRTTLALPALTIYTPTPRPKDELIVGHAAHRYRVRADWAQVHPRQYPLLNCHEMVTDKAGKLYLLGDHPANNVLVFDRSGKVLDSWGYRYPGGHGLTIAEDDAGEEFLLICDAGGHTDPQGRYRDQPGSVTKTRLDGNVVFQFGHPQTIGIYEPGMRYHPTETAVAPNGDIYVADGYGSNYVIRYDHRGRYLQHFGGQGNDDPNYDLHQAHGVAVDLRGPQPRLVVTSRNDQAFKFFTLDGKFLEQVTIPGAYVCRPVLHGDHLYAGVCFADTAAGESRQRHHGYATILDIDNKVVSNPGGSEPAYVAGKLQPQFQDSRVHGLFHHGHDVCVDADENLYLCQWNAKGVPPILLEKV